MKREIKFRLWAKDPCSSVSNEEMVYLPVWTVFDGRDLVFRTDLDTFWIDSSADGGAVVMQFTGLRDKNGVEIYEGDILRGVTDNIFAGEKIKTYEVMWGVDHWHIKGTSFFLQEFFNYCNRNVEVVGNVYEHPELLGSAGM